MSFVTKDSRNNKFLRTHNNQHRGNPIEAEKKLQNKSKRLAQRVTAVEEHLNKVEKMQENGDLTYFEMMKYNYPTLAKEANEKIREISGKVEYLVRVSKKKEKEMIKK